PASGINVRAKRNASAIQHSIDFFSLPAACARVSWLKAAALIGWLSGRDGKQEGLKLTPAALDRLQTATGRFVKLPDSGWVELDSDAVQSAHETMADLGVDGLVPVAQKIGMEHAAHLDEQELQRFGDSPQAKALREKLKDFRGVPSADLPPTVQDGK